MLKEEKYRRQFGRIRNAAGKSRGLPISVVTTIDESSTKTSHERRQAVDYPFSSRQLFGDLGCMGKRSVVNEILLGTYVFPEDCPAEARELCAQASRLYHKIPDE